MGFAILHGEHQLTTYRMPWQQSMYEHYYIAPITYLRIQERHWIGTTYHTPSLHYS